MNPLRAALRAARTRLGADTLRAVVRDMALAAADAVLDDLDASERKPRERTIPQPSNDVPMDDLAQAAARKARRRLGLT